MEIYQDQEALLIFPVSEKVPDKNAKIFDFFKKGVYLFVDKRDNNSCNIYCHIIVQEPPERDRGIYAVYVGNYSHDLFTKFKDDIDENLLRLQFKRSDIRNVEFDHLKSFDIMEQDVHKHDELSDNMQNKKLLSTDISTDAATYALKDSQYLEYRGGINSIVKLSRELIKFDNMKIMICRDSNESSDGSVDASNLSLYRQINFVIDKTNNNTPLVPTERSRQILERYKKNIYENKKKDMGKPGIDNINDAAGKMKKGIQTLAKAGYSNREIKNTINIHIDDIIKLADTIPITPVRTLTEDGNWKNKKFNTIIPKILIIAVVILIMLIILKYFHPEYLSKIETIIKSSFG